MSDFLDRTLENNVIRASDKSSTKPPAVSRLACLFKPILLSLTVLVLSQSGSAQPKSEMFDTKNLAREIKARYGLSSRDVRAIEPLLREENRRTVEIYSRFGGAEAEYSRRVWLQVVTDRLRFESKVPGLSNKQANALRSARSRMEKRLLQYLIEDHVAFLDEVLSFDEFEFADVMEVLESEVEKKLRLVSAHVSKPSILVKELDEVSRETEAGLRKAMHPDQWHGYRKLTDAHELIA